MNGTVSSLGQSERPITLEEALRTLGLALETIQPQRVTFTIDLDGIRVDVRGASGSGFYRWDDLLVLQRSWQAQRRIPPPRGPLADPWSLARWSVLLRAAGALLDRHQITGCVLQASAVSAGPPQDATLHAIVDGRELFDTQDVRQYILRQRLRDSRRLVAS